MRNPTNEQRQEHIGRSLLELSTLFTLDSLQRLESMGYPKLSRSDIDVIASITSEGAYAVDIAKRIGVTKQAVSKKIDRLISIGILAKEKSEEDQRLYRIQFTDAGQKLLTNAIQCIALIEQEWKQKLGDRDFLILKELLRKATELL